MRRSVIETVLGAVVLLVAGLFLVFAYNSSDLKPVNGYEVSTRFNSIDGLTVGSDVRIGGVKIGSVIDQYIDPELYQAVVRLSLRQDVRLPDDTQLAVSSNGLLGGKYVKVTPGSSDTQVADGGEFTNTKDVLSLEEMLGRVIFLVTDEDVE